MKKLWMGALVLAGCMEPQVAPDLEVTEADAYDVQVLASGLESPWSVAPLADGGALVTERPGRLWRVAASGETVEITGLPNDMFVLGPQKQAGLLDIVPAADFAESGRVFLSSATGTAEANGTTLFTARLAGDRLMELERLFDADRKDTDPHFGGKIVVMPDETVLLSTGDGFAYREMAQDTDSTLGKVLRLNADGSIPADNPFGNAVWSYGHRNVQGLALDTATGELWEHEHGPRGGDELNLISKGANYGWPVATTGSDYNGLRISPFETVEGMEAYVHQWTPSIAPSGLVIYRGDMFPEWQGDALVGALAGKSVRRVDLEDGRSVGEEIVFRIRQAQSEEAQSEEGETPGFSRIRDIREAPDGSLYVLTNEGTNSRLLRVAAKGSAS